MEYCPPGELPGAFITPNARDEFGTLKTAVVSGFTAPEIIPAELGATPDDLKMLFSDPTGPANARHHFAFTQLLRERSIRLLYPHLTHEELTVQNLADVIGKDIYCRDFMGVVDDRAILTNVVPFRNENRIRFENVAKRIPKEKLESVDAVFTWGNALLDGDTLLVGLEPPQYFEDIVSSLSSEEFLERLRFHDQERSGINVVRTMLQNRGSMRSVLVVPKNSNHDLDFAIAPLPRRSKYEKRRAIIQPELLFTTAGEALYSRYDELIPSLDHEDAMACNILWLDPETPVLPLEATHTAECLRMFGYDVIALPLGALQQIGSDGSGSPGAWRCMTGVLERANDYEYA